MDRISVEREIESLQSECQSLEEQLNEALHASSEGNNWKFNGPSSVDPFKFTEYYSIRAEAIS